MRKRGALSTRPDMPGQPGLKLTAAQRAVLRLLIDRQGETVTSADAAYVLRTHGHPAVELEDGTRALEQLEARRLARRVGRAWSVPSPFGKWDAGPSHGPARDPARELLWLELAEASAGHAGFTDHVLARLAAGQHVYGDEWAGLSFDRLLTELEEEAADIGAWGVLALQKLAANPDVSDAMRDHIAIVVHVAIAMAAYAYQALKLAREDLKLGWASTAEQSHTEHRRTRCEGS
jgi:hypothetical protein